MRSGILAFFICISVFFAYSSQAQEVNPKDLVVVCKTQAEVKEARARGEVYIQVGKSYFVNIGGDYQGPFREFDSVVKLREQYVKNAKEAGIIFSSPDGSSSKSYHNPSLMMFPFIDLTKDKTFLFSAPADEIVETTRIMVHAEPLVFDEIAFGPVNLRERGYYFAVTGKILARESVDFPTDELKISVGASVLSENGTILWKGYGSVGQ